MSLHDGIAAAVKGHNIMAVALSRIALGNHATDAAEIAAKALADLELDAYRVLTVHIEFKAVYGKIRKRGGDG